jgi:hypothetical protein
MTINLGHLEKGGTEIKKMPKIEPANKKIIEAAKREFKKMPPIKERQK